MKLANFPASLLKLFETGEVVEETIQLVLKDFGTHMLEVLVTLLPNWKEGLQLVSILLAVIVQLEESIVNMAANLLDPSQLPLLLVGIETELVSEHLILQTNRVNKSQSKR